MGGIGKGECEFAAGIVHGNAAGMVKIAMGQHHMLDLVATGNATTLPGFTEDLEAERLEIEEDLGKYFKFYPVISLGIAIGF